VLRFGGRLPPDFFDTKPARGGVAGWRAVLWRQAPQRRCFERAAE
jgi:hypothetical protein